MPVGHISRQQKYASRGIGHGRQLRDNMPMRQKHFIREWRKYRGLTQVQFAERIGMNQGHLSRIEKGQRPYDQEFLERAATELNCDPADLIMRDPSAAEAIWSIWEQLEPTARQQVVEIAKTFKKAG